jgi:hypothetical protein
MIQIVENWYNKMFFLKEIRTKFKVRTRLLKFISYLQIIHQYILGSKPTTLKKWCAEIEVFPNQEETKILPRDWYLLIRKPEIIQRKFPISLDEIELKKFQVYYSKTTQYRKISEVFLSCLSKAKIISKNNYDGFYPLSSEGNVS